MNFSNNPISFKFSLFVMIIGLAVFTASCDNPAGTDEEEHHHDHDPYGLELHMEGEVIFRYFDGQTEGHQHLTAGEESPLITVVFLDEAGDPIPSASIGADHSLGWEIGNEEVLAIHQKEGESKYTFHFEALSEGESAVQFMLMHGTGSSAHAHFKTPDVTQENAIEMHIDAADGSSDHGHNHK